ncbi:protein RIC-3-like [Anneissia japonica]|uniref:protein RIC-3-like n=1 Tax=Anneissia japonica TaxID=1529436 RepID=UPI0014257A7A|nr:protein RIC-3-like [Anneissia japonica]
MAMHHTAVFVFIVIIGCNLVLYPSLFSKLIRQWFGGAEMKPTAQDPLEDVPPPMRGRPPSFQGPASVKYRQSSMPDRSAFPSSTKTQEPGFKGIMGSVLPVYAVGIMIYFMFVIYKVFLKEKPTKDPGTGRLLKNSINASSMDRRLREEEELLQKRLSEELRKHGYHNIKPDTHHADLTTPSENIVSADAEVAVLKNRLEQTERTMAKMLEMMTSMGISVSQMTNHLENMEDKSEDPSTPSDVDEEHECDTDMEVDDIGEIAYDDSDSDNEAYENGASVKKECDKYTDKEDTNVTVDEVENIRANERIEEEEATLRRRNITGQQD